VWFRAYVVVKLLFSQLDSYPVSVINIVYSVSTGIRDRLQAAEHTGTNHPTGKNVSKMNYFVSIVLKLSRSYTFYRATLC